MRTLPPPSILPSIVMSEAISDSLRGTPGSARPTGVAAELGASSGFGGMSNRTGSLDSGTGVVGVVGVCRGAVLSFHIAMMHLSGGDRGLRLALKRGAGNDYVIKVAPSHRAVTAAQLDALPVLPVGAYLTRGRRSRNAHRERERDL